jgi:outer membrane protein assembly factor BamA
VRFKGFIFTLAFLLLASPGAVALSRHVPDLSRYEGRTVASVELVVEEASVEEAALAEFRAVLKIAEGNRFSAVLVRDSLQALFDTNRVAGARVEAWDAAGPPAAGEGNRPRVALRFVVKPQVLLSDVEFEVGVTEGTGISEDELRARINLLLALPVEKLDRLTLKRQLDEIGNAASERLISDRTA